VDHIKRIAVLMTCYNRRETTLECLRALYDQELPGGVNFDTYLVDDGCTDGTGEAVRDAYPDVHVLEGDGSLYWCGGMRLAFAEAMKGSYDFYLWLNDDTFLVPSACKLLLSDYEKVRGDGLRQHIIVGTTQDPNTGHMTYGGHIRCSIWHPFHYKAVLPGNEPKLCDTMNGNCVLIAREVVELVGNLDSAFTHAQGDDDYCLRARNVGCSIWVAAGYVGTCERNNLRGTYRDGTLPLRKRWAMMLSYTGLPPRERMLFVRRHGGTLWPIVFCLPYLKCIFLKRG